MEWYRSRNGWLLTVMGFGALIVQYILEPWEWEHAAISIFEMTRRNSHYLKPWIAPALFLVAVYFFERDRRKTYNPKTLKGRTLKLRDQMQAFLDGLGPIPRTAPERYGGVSQVHVGADWRDADAAMQDSTIQRARGTNLREAKIEYGYELYFAADVLRIYNEFGVRGIRDLKFQKTLFIQNPKTEGYKSELDLNEIISALSRLAETKEADSTLSRLE